MIYHSKALIELDIKIFFWIFSVHFDECTEVRKFVWWSTVSVEWWDGERKNDWQVKLVAERWNFSPSLTMPGKPSKNLGVNFVYWGKFCEWMSWILLWIRSRSMLLLQILKFETWSKLLQVLNFRNLKQICCKF